MTIVNPFNAKRLPNDELNRLALDRVKSIGVMREPTAVTALRNPGNAEQRLVILTPHFFGHTEDKPNIYTLQNISFYRKRNVIVVRFSNNLHSFGFTSELTGSFK